MEPRGEGHTPGCWQREPLGRGGGGGQEVGLLCAVPGACVIFPLFLLGLVNTLILCTSIGQLLGLHNNLLSSRLIDHLITNGEIEVLGVS